jgi:hypothetical protein
MNNYTYLLPKDKNNCKITFANKNTVITTWEMASVYALERINKRRKVTNIEEL